MTLQPLAYTPAEVAELLKMSKPTVYRLVTSGTIPAQRYGKLIRIPAWWVREQMERKAA